MKFQIKIVVAMFFFGFLMMPHVFALAQDDTVLSSSLLESNGYNKPNTRLNWGLTSLAEINTVNIPNEVEFTPLMRAVKLADSARVSVLLSNGADANSQNNKGVTALMLAAHYGYTDIMSLLLTSKVKINMQERYKAFIAAIDNEQKDAVLLLLPYLQGEKNELAHLMRVASMDGKDLASLIIAKAKERKLAMARLGISNQIGVNAIDAKDDYGFPPLVLASFAGNKAWALELLDKQANVNVRDYEGITPIIAASGLGHKEIVSLLIHNKANIDIGNKDNINALMMASLSGHTDIVSLLLSNKAKVNDKSKDSDTALMNVARMGYKDIASLLLVNKADVDAQDSRGNTALMLAAYYGHHDMVSLLIGHKANVNIKDRNGSTALISASFMGHKDIVSLLIANKADIDSQDKVGNTALIAAVYRNHKNIVSLLIDNKVDINAKGDTGVTALMAAVQKGYKDIVELLVTNKADIYSKAKDGDTPLTLASKIGRQDIEVSLLAGKSKIDTQNGDGFRTLNEQPYGESRDEFKRENSFDLVVADKSQQAAVVIFLFCMCMIACGIGLSIMINMINKRTVKEDNVGTINIDAYELDMSSDSINSEFMNNIFTYRDIVGLACISLFVGLLQSQGRLLPLTIFLFCLGVGLLCKCISYISNRGVRTFKLFCRDVAELAILYFIMSISTLIFPFLMLILGILDYDIAPGGIILSLTIGPIVRAIYVMLIAYGILYLMTKFTRKTPVLIE